MGKECNILMWHKLLIILFSIIFTAPCFAQGLPPMGISDEGGAVSRPMFILDCSGAGVECSHSGVTGTITVSGTDSIGFVLETPADADAFLIWKAPHAITITDIDCIVGAATSAVIDIQECDSAGANCATVDATITCDADGAADDGTLSNGGIDAGDWLKLDIGTVTGTVKYVSGTVTFTRND